MIVVDTNVIAYLFLPTQFTTLSENLLKLDSEWAAPALWRSEMRNVLCLYLKKDVIDFDTAIEIQEQAESLLLDCEYEVNSLNVLSLAHESGCSAYDSEFIALARSLGTKLITSDKKILKRFPKDTQSLKDMS